MENPNKQHLRTKKVSTYLSQRELDAVRKKVANSSCRGLSEYSWKLLMGVPVIYYTRNKSLDDFVAECVRIRGEIKKVVSMVPLSPEAEKRLVELFVAINEQLKIVSIDVYKNKNKQKHRSKSPVPRAEAGPETPPVYSGGEFPQEPGGAELEGQALPFSAADLAERKGPAEYDTYFDEFPDFGGDHE